MGEVNAAERAALSGTLGSLQPEFEQNFNCEQSLNKVWIWNSRTNKVWTHYELSNFDCVRLEQTVNKVCPPNLTMEKVEQRLNRLWRNIEFFSLNLNNVWTMFEFEHCLNILWTEFEQSLNKVWILCSNIVQAHILQEHRNLIIAAASNSKSN